MKYIMLMALFFCGCAGRSITVHIENPGDPCLAHNHAESEEDDHDNENIVSMLVVAGTHLHHTRSFQNHKEMFDVPSNHGYEVELVEEFAE